MFLCAKSQTSTFLRSSETLVFLLKPSHKQTSHLIQTLSEKLW